MHEFSAHKSISCSQSLPKENPTIYILDSNPQYSTIQSLILPAQLHTTSFWNIIIQWSSHDDLIEFFSLLAKPLITWWSEKKSCQMTEIQNCTLWFDRKTVSVEFCQLAVLDWDFKSIWKPNPCMDPLEIKYIMSVLILFFAG